MFSKNVPIIVLRGDVKQSPFGLSCSKPYNDGTTEIGIQGVGSMDEQSGESKQEKY